MKKFLLIVLLLLLFITLGWYVIQGWGKDPAPPPEQLVWQKGRGYSCRKIGQPQDIIWEIKDTGRRWRSKGSFLFK